MSSIPQNHFDENDLIDCVQRFFSKHHVGNLLARCNGMKEKGVSPVSLLRYKLSNIFVGRSMYMQQRTGSFKEDFSKNTFYRFLNSVKTNWLRFTSLLAADIVNNDLKDLTDDNRKNVFIIDDSLFNRTSCKKTELASKVFDHTDMHFKKGFRMLTLFQTIFHQFELQMFCYHNHCADAVDYKVTSEAPAFGCTASGISFSKPPKLYCSLCDLWHGRHENR